MKHTMKKLFSLLLTILVLSSVMPVAFAASEDFGAVTLTDSTTVFDHFDYTLNDSHGFVSGDPNTIVSTEFNTNGQYA